MGAGTAIAFEKPFKPSQRIAGQFARLLDRIEPWHRERGMYARRVAAIGNKLKSEPGRRALIDCSSFARGTAIARFSDIEMLWVMPTSPSSPGEVLKYVSERLADQSWTAKCARDGVQVRFDSDEHPLVVIPAVMAGIETGHAVFRVPDGRGAWRSTSPGADEYALSRAEAQSRGRLKNTVKLMTYWGYCQCPQIAFRSASWERVLIKGQAWARSSGYSQCVADALATAAAESDHRLRRAASFAAEQARWALLAEADKKWHEAEREWNLVFNGGFAQW